MAVDVTRNEDADCRLQTGLGMKAEVEVECRSGDDDVRWASKRNG